MREKIFMMKIFNNKTPQLFYRADVLSLGVKQSIPLELERYPHFLIVGSTGTGKTISAKYILAKIALSVSDIQLWICDYKNFDFVEFLGCKHHFAYKDCLDGIEKFYSEFQQDLQSKNRVADQRKILFIDELSSFILSQEKKTAEHIKSMISELLFLGRSYHYSVFTAVQRADSEFFKNGAREQFGAVLMLGNLSKEQKAMLAYDFKEEMTENCSKGQGYFLKDGEGIYYIQVPIIRKFEKMDDVLKEALDR